MKSEELLPTATRCFPRGAADMAAVAQRLSDANLPGNLREGTLDLVDPEGNRLRIMAADS
ncbi:MAG: hypothetical protein ABJB10_18545 [Mesorhizobium sp.]